MAWLECGYGQAREWANWRRGRWGSVETHRPLGVVLVEQGLVSNDDVDGALAVQVKTSQPLGEILLERSLIARPLLAKALAAQRGRLLDKEGGFGSGLMARLEHVHLVRRGLPTELPRVDPDTTAEDRCSDLPGV